MLFISKSLKTHIWNSQLWMCVHLSTKTRAELHFVPFLVCAGFETWSGVNHNFVFFVSQSLGTHFWDSLFWRRFRLPKVGTPFGIYFPRSCVRYLFNLKVYFWNPPIWIRVHLINVGALFRIKFSKELYPVTLTKDAEARVLLSTTLTKCAEVDVCSCSGMQPSLGLYMK